MNTKAMTLSSLLVVLMVITTSRAATLNIVNGGFEDGSATDSSFTPIAGWTDAGTSAGFWLSTGEPVHTSLDAASSQDGSMFLSCNRLVGSAASQPADSMLSQTVNLSAENLALVATGSARLNLRFYYHDEDSADVGTVTVTFLDGALNELGSLTTGQMSGQSYPSDGSAEWTPVELAGGMSRATESVRIDISTHRISATAINLQFDSFSGNIAVSTNTIPITIWPLGDSITYGAGVAGGYRETLYSNLTARGCVPELVGTRTDNSTTLLTAAFQTHHEGHSGYSITNAVNIDGGTRAGIYEGVVSWHTSIATPDVILLMIGNQRSQHRV